MASAAGLQALQTALGLSLSREWLHSFSTQAQPDFAAASAQRQRELLFAAFLVADLKQAGQACLPPDLQVEPLLQHQNFLAGSKPALPQS